MVAGFEPTVSGSCLNFVFNCCRRPLHTTGFEPAKFSPSVQYNRPLGPLGYMCWTDRTKRHFPGENRRSIFFVFFAVDDLGAFLPECGGNLFTGVVHSPHRHNYGKSSRRELNPSLPLQMGCTSHCTTTLTHNLDRTSISGESIIPAHYHCAICV